jgi:hypothetical protein
MEMKIWQPKTTESRLNLPHLQLNIPEAHKQIDFQLYV